MCCAVLYHCYAANVYCVCVPLRKLLFWTVLVEPDEKPLSTLSLPIGHCATVQHCHTRKPAGVTTYQHETGSWERCPLVCEGFDLKVFRLTVLTGDCVARRW